MKKQRSRMLRRILRTGFGLIVGFLLLRLTGQSNLLESLYEKAFPTERSFGAAEATLIPLPSAAGGGSKLDIVAVQILLLKHDKEDAETVTVLTRSPLLTPSPLLLGGLGHEPLPRSQTGGLPPTRILLEAELPGNSLMIVATPASRIPTTQKSVYAFRTGSLISEGPRQPTLVFQTLNEIRGRQAFYCGVALLVPWVLWSAAHFGPLRYPEDRRESSLSL